MKEDIILKIENLSKQYRLGTVGAKTIGHDLNRFFAKIRGKEDPYLKIGESNDRTNKGTSEYVWALKDINFEVRRGEVLGVIGKNGAGKSTLLKILSKVTGPTTGSIKSKGRIASLLEVGTGFHPEMTGRENVFLNGAILGMTKKEIESKLSEIISFSGCERYIDTPVKRYSSGMTVRLAFAVAAHLEPDILIVDEVLAVGDAEFQKKAIGKMQDISNSQGRTVLFVSHNMAAIESLCTKSILLKKGQISFYGNTKSVISKYILENTSKNIDNKLFQDESLRMGSGEVKVVGIEIRDKNGSMVDTVSSGETLQIVLKFTNQYPNRKYTIIPGISIKSSNDQAIILHHSRLNGKIYKKLPAKGNFVFTIDKLLLVPNSYVLSYSLVNEDKILDSLDISFQLNVIESNFYGNGEIVPASHAILLANGSWELN
jgi:lipopolysaccharide transport system ATP-binding protein